MKGLARVRAPWRSWDETVLRRNAGVYVHIPFCLRRCRYCDFTSFGLNRLDPAAMSEYVAQLTSEIALRGAWAREILGAAGRCVDTVFFGGGTPTCLVREDLAGLIEAVRSAFGATPAAEVTVEANPETLDADYITCLAQAGVNRLSIGVQAVQDRHLRFLGRVHRWARTARALDCAVNGPVRRISVDMIYAVPRMTSAELKEALRLLLVYAPEHLSAYELTLEPRTWLWHWAGRHPRQVAAPEVAVAQQRLVERMLRSAGLYRYEVSNYARPGAECRHNLRYWRGGDYIGLGLGAASRIGSALLSNPDAMAGYTAFVSGIGAGTGDPLYKLALAAEVSCAGPAPPADAFLRLRTRSGLLLEEIAPGVRAQLGQWLSRGWVRIAHRRLEVTARGMDFADAIARDCLVDPDYPHAGT